jgi:hypothetical protein
MSVRSLEASQVIAIREMRVREGAALRQIAEYALMNWRKRVPLAIISRIVSHELYPECGGPRLTPAAARKLTLTRQRIASIARRKEFA